MKLDEIDFWERVLRGEGAASRGQQAEATSSVTVRYDWGGAKDIKKEAFYSDRHRVSLTVSICKKM